MDPKAAAAAAALKQFVTEDFTLFAIGVSFTALRTYARILQVGVRGFQVDDYFIWIAMLFYAAETALAYSVGHYAQGLANNGMTDEQRQNLDPRSHEYMLRVIGCKIQLAGWSTYSALLWSLKVSLLVFYIRLTRGLNRNYSLRIYIGFVLLFCSWLAATLNLFLGCRPFNRNWQINPNPGNVCQPAISTRVVWVYGTLNIITDLYLLSIPIPMLWKSSLRPLKKFGLIILFSGGVLVIIFAILRATFIITDPVNGAQVAGSWAVRETFVSVITTNLPMVFPLFKSRLTSISDSIVRYIGYSRAKSSNGAFRSYIRTWGGGNKQSWRGRGPRTPNPITGLTYTESEEQIMKSQNVKENLPVQLQDLETTATVAHAENIDNNNNIRQDREVVVTSVPDDRVPQSQHTGNLSFANSAPRTSHITYIMAGGQRDGAS
ncbi:hypothetical protein F5B22DRAFT_605914 [Xylaria bambusicola]|uniref:uncharacterized protein n=1 Tax=Xylaria bambusicola TaxID=326684 RepID=UPI0020082753|nr:uncharacterized protein F5B22DRAFT_605914 [Xylaria bambusicola]KAI0517021.1 hypothetical protein F5B22DRAFT_605914 [Xylaria bambusicola]